MEIKPSFYLANIKLRSMAHKTAIHILLSIIHGYIYSLNTFFMRKQMMIQVQYLRRNIILHFLSLKYNFVFYNFTGVVLKRLIFLFHIRFIMYIIRSIMNILHISNKTLKWYPRSASSFYIFRKQVHSKIYTYLKPFYSLSLQHSSYSSPLVRSIRCVYSALPRFAPFIITKRYTGKGLPGHSSNIGKTVIGSTSSTSANTSSLSSITRTASRKITESYKKETYSTQETTNLRASIKKPTMERIDSFESKLQSKKTESFYTKLRYVEDIKKGRSIETKPTKLPREYNNNKKPLPEPLYRPVPVIAPVVPTEAYTEQLPVPHDHRPTLPFIKELNNKTVDVRIALDKKADSPEKTGIFAFMENASIRYAYSNLFRRLYRPRTREIALTVPSTSTNKESTPMSVQAPDSNKTESPEIAPGFTSEPLDIPEPPFKPEPTPEQEPSIYPAHPSTGSVTNSDQLSPLPENTPLDVVLQKTLAVKLIKKDDVPSVQVTLVNNNQNVTIGVSKNHYKLTQDGVAEAEEYFGTIPRKIVAESQDLSTEYKLTLVAPIPINDETVIANARQKHMIILVVTDKTGEKHYYKAGMLSSKSSGTPLSDIKFKVFAEQQQKGIKVGSTSSEKNSPQRYILFNNLEETSPDVMNREILYGEEYLKSTPAVTNLKKKIKESAQNPVVEYEDKKITLKILIELYNKHIYYINNKKPLPTTAEKKMVDAENTKKQKEGNLLKKQNKNKDNDKKHKNEQNPFA